MKISPEAYSVQDATPAHLPAAVGVEYTSCMATYPNPELGITEDNIRRWGWGIDRIRKYEALFLSNPFAKAWVAIDPNTEQIVADLIVTHNPPEYSTNPEDGFFDGHPYVRKLYVLPEYQGTGLGRRLLTEYGEPWLQAGDETAGRPPADAIYAEVATHTGSGNFYRGLGYEREEIRPLVPEREARCGISMETEILRKCVMRSTVKLGLPA